MEVSLWPLGKKVSGPVKSGFWVVYEGTVVRTEFGTPVQVLLWPPHPDEPAFFSEAKIQDEPALFSEAKTRP
jgi:hypothetical protein